MTATLVWFRQDLRLADNPALQAALERGPVIPVYLFAPDEESPWAPGAASRWWLHHSLKSLAADLERCGSRLILRAGAASCVMLQRLVEECGATRVVWNRRYEPAVIARDQGIKAALRTGGTASESFNASLLHEPWTIKTKGSGGAFQVFTPFWRHCRSLEDPPEPLPTPHRLDGPARWPDSADLDDLKLLPRLDWAAGFGEVWQPGRAGALDALRIFLAQTSSDYSTLRDRPAVAGTSRLSPHLHFGEIGPREIWHALRRSAAESGDDAAWRNSTFLTEVGWREFAYHLLYHFPHTPGAPLRAKFADFPWSHDAAAQRAWEAGRTGYPIVDAGLRQLWHTGWMHNRVRMIAASFLIKDLLIDWTTGARWFWETLVDADLASNTLGWQWVAGCGADAAPFFRIFNPVTQGSRFDPQGDYVRRWVPELERLPQEWIHQPWAAPATVLERAGVSLGTTYPHPIVDHDTARRAALAALARINA